ncbi:PHP domain-containing protein [Kribbia dieselivorans]|uniref:PHP domain-containing protein n=1 Tax=Kribbia dieselivorans TaxID=331526 RepID=UPI000839890F|nr:PHP domain-containing protein [Kribbia dieselivorans]
MQQVAEIAAPITPSAALRRVAFYMERSRAGSYRVDAFRKALATVRELGDDAVAGLVADGTLTDVPGIGPSTAEVISQAVAGGLPSRLATLQANAAAPLEEGGAELFAQVRGDCHLHSDWSDGGSPIDEMVLTAVELGHEWMVLTDHSPRLKVANGLSPTRLRRQIGLIDQINTALGASFTLLKGIEVDILDGGELDQEPDLLDELDLVTASVHSKLRMANKPMTERMLAAVRTPRVNVLGHCTGRLVEGSRGTRPQSEFDAEAVFTACVENDVAVEINSRPERCDPPDELITLALDLGCLFAIDSDAHAPGQLEMKRYGCARAERLGVPAERIVTTWPVERLLAWSRAR